MSVYDVFTVEEVLKDINVKECPWLEVQDKHGNKAKYYREPQWIPCSERLPEVGAILISDGNQLLIGRYYGDNMWTIDGCEYDPILEEVAWMPLPEPYRGADMRGEENV